MEIEQERWDAVTATLNRKSSDKCPDCDKHYEIGDFPFPCGGLGHAPGPFFTSDAQLRESDKVVIDYNPRTGVIHTPGRADRPMHPKKIADGFVRQKLNTISDIKRFEKRTGKVSEVLNYHKNSAASERDIGAE